MTKARRHGGGKGRLTKASSAAKPASSSAAKKRRHDALADAADTLSQGERNSSKKNKLPPAGDELSPPGSPVHSDNGSESDVEDDDDDEEDSEEEDADAVDAEDSAEAAAALTGSRKLDKVRSSSASTPSKTTDKKRTSPRKPPSLAPLSKAPSSAPSSNAGTPSRAPETAAPDAAQGGPGFPLKDSKATHALNVHLAPMVISSGLAVTFADVTSKADRMSLVVKVIKGSNVLSLRESIDSVSTRYPLQMEELDKGMLGVHNTTQQTNRAAFRKGLNRLFTSSPATDPQVRTALRDLGWTENSPVFGLGTHCLETAGAPFVLAPEKASFRSSIDVKSDVGAEFLNLLKNISRFTPGEPGHDIKARPFFRKKPSGGLRIFNNVTAYLWFTCLGKCNQLAAAVLPGPGALLTDVFARKQLNEDGTPGERFLINEEFIAALDYYVAVSLSAKVGDAESMAGFYFERVAIYKALDGQNSRRDWRPLLIQQLSGWLEAFPECSSKRRSRLSGGAADRAQVPYVVSVEDL